MDNNTAMDAGQPAHTPHTLHTHRRALAVKAIPRWGLAAALLVCVLTLWGCSVNRYSQMEQNHRIKTIYDTPQPDYRVDTYEFWSGDHNPIKVKDQLYIPGSTNKNSLYLSMNRATWWLLLTESK